MKKTAFFQVSLGTCK